MRGKCSGYQVLCKSAKAISGLNFTHKYSPLSWNTWLYWRKWETHEWSRVCDIFCICRASAGWATPSGRSSPASSLQRPAHGPRHGLQPPYPTLVPWTPFPLALWDNRSHPRNFTTPWILCVCSTFRRFPWLLMAKFSPGFHFPLRQLPMAVHSSSPVSWSLCVYVCVCCLVAVGWGHFQRSVITFTCRLLIKMPIVWTHTHLHLPTRRLLHFHGC